MILWSHNDILSRYVLPNVQTATSAFHKVVTVV